jgi:signal transduction histidine kinase
MPEIRDLLQEHLFDEAPIAIAVLDQASGILEANAKFQTVFGPAAGHRCFELLKNRSQPCGGCMLQKTLADGRVRVHEESLRLKAGRSHPFVVRVVPLAQGRLPGTRHAIWMATDVTEATSLQMENEILFERVPCYVTVLDRDMRIVRANRRMRETFGGGRGKRCYEVYKRRNRVCRECPAVKTFADGKDHTATQVGLTPSGEEVHYVVTASALAREGGARLGRVRYVIEVAADVTPIRVLEREKLEAERLAAVGQTVAGLAHGIKNILMGLEGGAYIMESGFRRNQIGKVEKGMQMLRRNLERMSSLVKSLLDFSRGRVPKVAMTDPNAVAGEVLELYGELARKAGIELALDLQPGLQPAPLDAEGLHTCLANLISNAIDACQMSDKRACRVLLRTFEEDGVLGLEVIDDGCGMDYEIKQKIFTTFFTTKGAGGTGLGLLMTRKIVQEHGGKILVESTPGQGTTCRILIPRDRLPALPADSEADAR